MACQITDVAVGALTGDFDPATGAISYITVTGSATGCRSGLLRVALSAGGQTYSAASVPVLSGGWSVRFKVGAVSCGDTVTVEATCLHEQNCRFTGNLQVSCCATDAELQISVAWALGTVTDAELQGWDCVAPGEVYTVTVSFPTGTGYTYDWLITEGRQPGDPADAFGVGSSTFPISLNDGVRRTILVIVHQPGDCPDLYRSVSFRACDAGVCPAPFVWNPQTQRCEPPACPAGEQWNPITNKCEKQPPQPTRPTEPDDPSGPGGGTPGKPEPRRCAGLLWAAVIALAISLLLVIFATCFSAISAYLYALAAILFVVYLGLLWLYRRLVRLGICKKKKCRVADVHVQVLAPIGMVLGIMAFLCIFLPLPWCACWNPYGLSAFGAVLGYWAERLRRCRASA